MGLDEGRLPLPLLCCLLLGAVRAGATVESPKERGAFASPSHMLPTSVEPVDGISTHSTSSPLSSGHKTASTLQPRTSGPTEEERTAETVAETERPVPKEDSSSWSNTAVLPIGEDTEAKGHHSSTSSSGHHSSTASSGHHNSTASPGHHNSTASSGHQNSTASLGYRKSTASSGPAPTLEVTPTDLTSIEEVVPPTQAPSPTPLRVETATLEAPQTEASSPTASRPATSHANLTGETTRGPAEEEETTQNATVLGSITEAADTTTNTRALPVATSSIPKATTVITTTSTTTATTTAATSTQESVDGRREPSILDVGDNGKEVPGVTSRALSNTDPLVVAVISVFIVMIGILGLVGFLRYRQRSSQTEFRRLQDLPMDDMMEDTPLSLYSY